MCDGVQDCSHGEDESECEDMCDPLTQFACPADPSSNVTALIDISPHCIKKKRVCDGIKDCRYGEGLLLMNKSEL